MADIGAEHMIVWAEAKFGFYSTKAKFYRWAYTRK